MLYIHKALARNPPNIRPMKHILPFILLLLSISVSAQDYKAEWEKVQQLEAEGLAKPASEEVNKIYALAKKDRNEPQMLKTFFFRAKYMQVLEEDVLVKIINSLLEERKTAGPATKAIIESLYAGMLEKIYNRNSYVIGQRTTLAEPAPENFMLWNSKNFETEIEAAYMRSLQERELLYKTPLADYNEVIDFSSMPVSAGRSLYDLLAEQYINASKGNDYIYDLTDDQSRKLFSESDKFATLNISDSIGKQFARHITFCKELEGYYLKKNDSYSFQRSVLRRLHYANAKTYPDEKRAIYIATLEKLSSDWGKSPFAYRAKITLARLYTSQANKRIAPGYLKKAVAVCDDIIANAALSDVAPEATNLKNALMATSIKLRAESNVIAGRPGLARISFTNTDTVTIKIYRISYSQTKSFKKLKEDGYFKNAPLYIEKSYALPAKNDLFEYTTEVILPPLEKGYYVITALTRDNSGLLDGTYASTIVHASGIAITKQMTGTEMIWQASDSKTGKPLKGIEMTANGKAYKTDRSGQVKVALLPSGMTKGVIFMHEGDTINTEYHDRYYSSNDDDKIRVNVQLYLDRAIYRPGQQVFFKGIVIKDKGGILSTVDNIFIKVSVSDNNGEEIYTSRLLTNEFGSFTGDFTLPKSGSTGRFEIFANEDEDYEEEEHPFWDDNDLEFEEGNVNFRVEEYKRPTFDVKFDAVKHDIRLNEEVFVTGNAKSFSGAAIQSGKVKYRVIRNARMTRYFYDVESDSKEIVTGEVTTDSDGKFKITFPAIPDPEFDPKGLPVFTYTIYADVTDIAGETHSTSKGVVAGYHSLELGIIVPAIIDPNLKNSISLDSENLNGEFRPVEGEMKIYKVAEDTRVYKDRPWGVPEIELISKEEFEKNFPLMPYDPIKKDTVIHEKLVGTLPVNTGNSKEVVLDGLKGWGSGKYEAVFTARDSVGNEVEVSSLFTLKKENGDLAANTEFLFEITNKDFKKDGYIEIEIRSGLPLLYVNVRAYNKNKSIYEKVVTLKGGRQTIKLPVTNKMYKQVALAFDFVWENELYDKQGIVVLGSSTENLDIESEAISNKLQPGSPQTWSFTIKNMDRLPAEMLASMYDASLDQFETDNWESLGETNSYRYGRNNVPNKSLINYNYGLYMDYNSGIIVKPETRKDDAFYTYGFDINRSGNVYSAYKPKGQAPGSRDFIISGTVDESLGPLPGTNVTIQGTSEGVQTDIDGRYTIYANKGDVLVFDFFGFKTKTITISESKTIDIVLQEDASNLKAVVVDSYRSVSAKRSTTAAYVITSQTIEGRSNADVLQSLQGQVAGLSIATGSGQPGADSTIILRGTGSINGHVQPLFVIDGIPVDEDGFRSLNQNDIATITVLKDAGATSIYGNRGANGVIVINTKKGQEEIKALQQVKARKNFNETAFFYPQLRTDKEGKIAFTFTMPEALTEWKLRILAHNKKVASGYLESTFRTQKDLMIVPNMPRFLREKDTVVIFAKVTNLTTESKDGNAMLQLFDAMTMKAMDAQMQNTNSLKPFTIPANGSTTVSWKIAVPEGMQGVQYKVLAKAGDFTDGEENILPVLPNSMLVTESIPLWVKPNSTKEYTLENLKNNTSPTLRHQGITLEYTSNPAWVALQSLPYLMEFEHECSEQVFSRYYANSIAAHIIKSNPKAEALFAEWRKNGAPASKLEQNEELKSVILAETPWLLDSQSEEEKKNRLALLFEFDKMKAALEANLDKLVKKQMASGGFPWFEGGSESEYITRHVLAGFGHLDKLGMKPADSVATKTLIKKGLAFTDTKFLEQYKKTIIAHGKKTSFIKWHPYTDLHYLYMRSFYLTSAPLSETLKQAVKPYLNDIKQDWLDYSLYEKGMAALALNRFGETVTAKKIVNSLRETSANNDEWGMYWINNKAGWDWYRAPIETQALLIEAFTEIDGDTKSADAMKVWLIKQKQNKSWPTTKSTSEAVYALLMQGSDWLSIKENTTITLGDSKLLEQKIAESGKEAETGYMKLHWNPEEVNTGMATLKIENKSAVPGYGGFYWQYFEDLDKIKPAQAGIMNINKELYLKTNTADGPQLRRITSANTLKIGELVTMRLVLEIKEDVEYVHLKDLRAAAFEPVDVLSGYKWKDGLGYYQSTRDAATHFFFDNIKKGTYVLEYDVRVNNAGEYSNGITTIQSMYAPEFSGHTKGIRVRTEE
jgi:TonB-dependent SusC/RagA subfamily outer membrane receptor